MSNDESIADAIEGAFGGAFQSYSVAGSDRESVNLVEVIDEHGKVVNEAANEIRRGLYRIAESIDGLANAIRETRGKGK
jgi:hypothetical protein